MCLSIPARIVSIEGTTAEVSAGGAVFRASLQMTENARVGDYILLHAGFAIQVLDEKEALQTLRMLEELDEAGNRPAE